MIKGDARKMLLVEDDPHDIELIQLALKDYPFIYEMEIAEDGEQALQYLFTRGENGLRETVPRFVLLDLKLPKINGIQVLEAIRNNPLTKKIVVVVMTSSAEDRDLETCYNLGVSSYVIKPFNSQQFTEIVRQVGYYWMMLNQPPLP
ncbi:MAG: response regulator [Crocosphaera sp.]